ncbi:hypothetical protein D3C76_1535580 [compost metagenome]
MESGEYSVEEKMETQVERRHVTGTGGELCPHYGLWFYSGQRIRYRLRCSGKRCRFVIQRSG